MKKQTVWLVLSIAITLVMVMVSCQQTKTPEEEETITSSETTQTSSTEYQTKEQPELETSKEPQYGGTLTVVTTRTSLEPTIWDPYEYLWMQALHTAPYQEHLLMGDLSRGARGTNEFSFNDYQYVPTDMLTGCLAESWEWTDPLTLIFHIRRGVMWPLKTGVMNSREMTADDVSFSLNRSFSAPTSAGAFDAIQSINAEDNYTVVVKFNQYDANWASILGYGNYSRIYPPELIDAGIEDWRNAVGTGPFRLTDYVSGSVLIYEKNPTYWGKTIINGKEYKIPFVDRVVWPIIKDSSTALASFRTGKIDINESINWKFKDTLVQSNPDLLMWRALNSPDVIGVKCDTPPFDDTKVRQALMLAIDKEGLIQSQYGGQAELVGWPFSPGWPRSLYTPFEDLPKATQELFSYDLEKAKTLMAEAGHTEGFKAEIVTTSAFTELCSILKAFWEEINVELDINVLEYAPRLSILNSKKYLHMIHMTKSSANPLEILKICFTPGQYWNTAMFDDPWFTDELNKAYEMRDPIEQAKVLKTLNAYALEKCAYIILPASYRYMFAWPYVKNYYGESSTSSYDDHSQIWATLWLDQDTKK